MINSFYRLIKNFKQPAPPDGDFFSVPTHLDYNFWLINPVYHDESHFAIESIGTLEKLLSVIRINKEKPVLRFLVDTSGVAWFARENNPHIKTPKHFQMTGLEQNKAQCKTAGNIKFTDNTCTVLKNINHRSGDFQPSFHSLRVFLAILVINEKKLPFKLPNIIVVKELNHEAKLKKKHSWRLNDIKTWAYSFIADKEIMARLSNQDFPTKYVYYKTTLVDMGVTPVAGEPSLRSG